MKSSEYSMEVLACLTCVRRHRLPIMANIYVIFNHCGWTEITIKNLYVYECAELIMRSIEGNNKRLVQLL